METTNPDGTKTEWGGAPGKIYDAHTLNLVNPDGTFATDFVDEIILAQGLVNDDVIKVSLEAYKAANPADGKYKGIWLKPSVDGT